MEIVSLVAPSQGELEGVQENFISRLFNRHFRAGQITSRKNEHWTEVLRGGFPSRRTQDAERRALGLAPTRHHSSRDVRELAHIEGV
jgi:hypothetical protein